MPTVGLALHENSMLYETAIAAEVFGADRSSLTPNRRWYEFVVCTESGRPSPWLPHHQTREFAALGDADTVIVPSTSVFEHQQDAALSAALHAAHTKGSRIAALCTGAFVLAAAGLLDGRSAATHWLHADELARMHPAVDVRADVLYVDDGYMLTSAGKTAALDLCLYLVHRDHGAAIANDLARRLVMPSHRPGGQAPFIAMPPDPSVTDRLEPMLSWAKRRLDQTITVRDLAREASLSTRQLSRRMRAELGVTPLAWLHQQRINRAQDLLERTDVSIEQIATACGMGTATTLRRHFIRSVGVSPTAYRATFANRTPDRPA